MKIENLVMVIICMIILVGCKSNEKEVVLMDPIIENYYESFFSLERQGEVEVVEEDGTRYVYEITGKTEKILQFLNGVLFEGNHSGIVTDSTRQELIVICSNYGIDEDKPFTKEFILDNQMDAINLVSDHRRFSTWRDDFDTYYDQVFSK